MILPNKVIEQIISILSASDYFEDITIKEGSEDTDMTVESKSVLIYPEFDESAEINAFGQPYNIPCSLYLAFTSYNKETAKEALNEALTMAYNAFNLLTQNNFLTVNNISGIPEQVILKSKDIPFNILANSASGSTVVLQLTFYLI
jgi:hypothetical protein